MAVVAAPTAASAQRWQDATAQCLGTTAQWTNKVEVADLDKDGHVDILVANGGNYMAAGTAEPSRIWRNLGNWSASAPHCTEITSTVLGAFTGLSRFIKAGDVDGDGDLDVLTSGAYQTQLKLFTQAAGVWTDASAQLPQQSLSAGDAEFGDIDGDGDVDLVIADWGAGNPSTNAGGRTKLYRNNGEGSFVDETVATMPDTLVRWSWDIELADVDNDWDLDILVACKACTRSYLFRNNGSGVFADDAAALPAFANNYDFEPMDIDADGDLDLITINDGPNITEHMFVNRGDGTFTDETGTRLAGAANPANADDNVAVWLDHDSDGDPDLLIGTLGNDRLLVNVSGVFMVDTMAATPNDTPGTLGLVVADFDGDTRPDLLQGQGETAFPEKLQLGGANVSVDVQPPVIRVAPPNGSIARARIHDRIGPSHAHDFASVIVRANGLEYPMRFVGGMMWHATVPMLGAYEVCATDRATNMKCEAYTPMPDAGMGGDDIIDDGPRGCCDTGSDARGSWGLAGLVALVLITTRRTGRRRASSRAPSR